MGSTSPLEDDPLVEAQANVRRRDMVGRTPLHKALERGAMDEILELCELGAEIEAMDNCGRRPIHYATRTIQSVDPATLSGDDQTVQDVRDENARICLAMMGALLDAGAEPNGVDAKGQTLLHHLVQMESSVAAANKCLEFLIRRGGDVTIRDERNQMCLHVAARRRPIKAIQKEQSALDTLLIDAQLGRPADRQPHTIYTPSALFFAVDSASVFLTSGLLDLMPDQHITLPVLVPALEKAIELSKQDCPSTDLEHRWRTVYHLLLNKGAKVLGREVAIGQLDAKYYRQFLGATIRVHRDQWCGRADLNHNVGTGLGKLLRRALQEVRIDDAQGSALHAWALQMAEQMTDWPGLGPSPIDMVGLLPLELSILTDHTQGRVFYALTQAGADPLQRDSHGRLAIEIAMQQSHLGLSTLLLREHASCTSARRWLRPKLGDSERRQHETVLEEAWQRMVRNQDWALVEAALRLGLGVNHSILQPYSLKLLAWTLSTGSYTVAEVYVNGPVTTKILRADLAKTRNQGPMWKRLSKFDLPGPSSLSRSHQLALASPEETLEMGKMRRYRHNRARCTVPFLHDFWAGLTSFSAVMSAASLQPSDIPQLLHLLNRKTPDQDLHSRFEAFVDFAAAEADFGFPVAFDVVSEQVHAELVDIYERVKQKDQKRGMEVVELLIRLSKLKFN